MRMRDHGTESILRLRSEAIHAHPLPWVDRAENISRLCYNSVLWRSLWPAVVEFSKNPEEDFVVSFVA